VGEGGQVIRLRRPRHDRVTLRCERFRQQQDDQRTEWIRKGAHSQGFADGRRSELARHSRILDTSGPPGVHVFCPQPPPKQTVMYMLIPERVRLQMVGGPISEIDGGQVVRIEAEQHRFRFATRNEFEFVKLAYWTWRPVL